MLFVTTRICATPRSRSHRGKPLGPELLFGKRGGEIALGRPQLEHRVHQQAFVARPILGQASQVLCLQPTDALLQTRNFIFQPLLFDPDEFQASLSGFDASGDMFINEILGERLGHLARRPLVGIRKVDLEGVDHRFTAPPRPLNE
ncbi:MAG: hypothetical protein VX304_16755, partial [Planctomycetota bacterium]|nr:hypothetical protein [Planctomycetota bacterium]